MEMFQAPSRIPFRADVYTYTDYRNGTAPKGGFVEAYFKAFEYAHKQIYEGITRKFAREIYGGPTASDMCRINNEYNAQVRKIVNRELHNHLFDGGAIEAYPYPAISFDISIKTTASRYNADYDDYDKHSYTDAYTIVFDPFSTEWRTENHSPKAGPRKFQYNPFYFESKYDRILYDKQCLEREIGALEYEKSKLLVKLRPGTRREIEQKILKLQNEYNALAAQHDFEEVEKKAAQYTKEFKSFAKQVYQAWYENTMHTNP